MTHSIWLLFFGRHLNENKSNYLNIYWLLLTMSPFVRFFMRRPSIDRLKPLSESVEKPSLLCDRICLQNCFKKGIMLEPCPVS